MNLRPEIIFVKDKDSNDRRWMSKWYSAGEIAGKGDLIYHFYSLTLESLRDLGISDDHFDTSTELLIPTEKESSYNPMLYTLYVRFDNDADECEFIMKMSDREQHSL